MATSSSGKAGLWNRVGVRQISRLAEQVAAQTALLTQIQATRANTLVKAADPLPAGQATASPATLENVVPQDRWVF